MSGLALKPADFFRFHDKVLVGDGCWEWAAGRSGSGYGGFAVHQRVEGAHRVAWELWNGPVPDGLQVCHRCDNPTCVRPDHLFLGTIQDNQRDKVAKGRGLANRDECPHGHPFDNAHSYVRPSGGKKCRTCDREGVRRRRGLLA